MYLSNAVTVPALFQRHASPTWGKPWYDWGDYVWAHESCHSNKHHAHGCRPRRALGPGWESTGWNALRTAIQHHCHASHLSWLCPLRLHQATSNKAALLSRAASEMRTMHLTGSQQQRRSTCFPSGSGEGKAPGTVYGVDLGKGLLVWPWNAHSLHNCALNEVSVFKRGDLCSGGVAPGWRGETGGRWCWGRKQGPAGRLTESGGPSRRSSTILSMVKALYFVVGAGGGLEPAAKNSESISHRH